MCKRKDNLERIKGCQSEINFRLDYFARPGSLDRLFANMPRDMDYFEYKPTEEDQQIIGYDDAARCLQRSLTELLFYPCKILKSKEGRDITIYIHRNFVSVQTYTTSSEENAEVIAYVSSILQPFLDDSDINVEDVSTRITFAQLGIAQKDLWTVFDHTAFPVLDDAEVRSGTYQDTHQVGELFIDLMRNIQTNEEGTIDGVVSSIALCSEDTLRSRVGTDGLPALLTSIVTESIAEITRCFAD